MHYVKNDGPMCKATSKQAANQTDTLYDSITNSFERRRRYASVRNSPNLLFLAAPLSTPEYTIKIVHFDPVLPGTQTDVAIMGGGGKASPSVSIFSRAPLCPNTCRHCRSKPCDIATDHDDHICYNCEQRLLFPERIPKWETQNLPICDLWCQECATQRCCTRGSHQYHLCMQCERRGVVFLAPVGGEDP